MTVTEGSCSESKSWTRFFTNFVYHRLLIVDGLGSWVIESTNKTFSDGRRFSKTKSCLPRL